MTILALDYQTRATAGEWDRSRYFVMMPGDPFEHLRGSICKMCQSPKMVLFKDVQPAPYKMGHSLSMIGGILCLACGWWHLHGVHESGDFDYGWCDVDGELVSYDIGDACTPLEIAAKYLSSHYSDVYRLPPRRFEELIFRVFREHFHCEVELTKQTRDGGKDLVCFDSDRGKFYVEVKHSTTGERRVGLALVQRFIGVLYQDQVDHGVLVTSTAFTQGAHETAKRISGRPEGIELELRDHQDVLSWLNVLSGPAIDPRSQLEKIEKLAPWPVKALTFGELPASP